jgi:hypothetical protein
MLELVLVLNVLWFAGGFHVFSIRSRIFAKLVVPREHRDTPVFETLIMTGKFLGGFNLAFLVLNILLLINTSLFDKDLQWAIILFATAIAHATQFAFNVPVALQNRRGEGVWQVKGLMRLIFVTDFVMMVLNFVLSSIYFF